MQKLAIWIFHNLHNLLSLLHDLLYNSSPPIIRCPSYKILDLLHIINSDIVIFGLFLSCIKCGAHHKSAPKGVNLHQNPPFRHCTNMTLKEAVEEIKACEEERKFVSKFEAKHRDEIDKILELIDYIDKGYIEENFPRFTTLTAKGWVYTSRIDWLLRVIQPIF